MDDEQIAAITELLADARTIIPTIAQPKETKIGYTTDDMISGKYKEKKQEPLTEQHQVVLTEIHDEEKKQDAILTDMSNALDGLQHVAITIKDTLDVQNVILEDATAKTEKVTEHLENANDRMVNLHKKLNSKSGKLCTYIICIVILLGLLSVLYNQFYK